METHQDTWEKTQAQEIRKGKDQTLSTKRAISSNYDSRNHWGPLMLCVSPSPEVKIPPPHTKPPSADERGGDSWWLGEGTITWWTHKNLKSRPSCLLDSPYIYNQLGNIKWVKILHLKYKIYVWFAVSDINCAVLEVIVERIFGSICQECEEKGKHFCISSGDL